MDQASNRSLSSYAHFDHRTSRYEPAGNVKSINRSYTCHEKIYSISVFPYSNYFVGRNGILVHNVNLAFLAVVAAEQLLVPIISECVALVMAASNGASLVPVAVSSLSFLKVSSDTAAVVSAKSTISATSAFSIKKAILSAAKAYPGVVLCLCAAGSVYGLYCIAKRYWIDDIDRLLQLQVLRPQVFPENNSTDPAQIYKKEWEECQAAEYRTKFGEPQALQPAAILRKESICQTPVLE